MIAGINGVLRSFSSAVSKALFCDAKYDIFNSKYKNKFLTVILNTNLLVNGEIPTTLISDQVFTKSINGERYFNHLSFINIIKRIKPFLQLQLTRKIGCDGAPPFFFVNCGNATFFKEKFTENDCFFF